MKHETLGEAGLSYAPCRYGTSRILFRGPRRSLDGRYLAFVGGTETFGKFIKHPFPHLVEERLNLPCVNFGCVNSGVDSFIRDDTIRTACHDAEMTIVQIVGAQNLSNRFYSVHPRRNDRFLRASAVLRAVYPETDFTEHCFTRHMLTTLYALSPLRFERLRVELQQAWTARMQQFLSEIGPNVILLWFARHLPSDRRWDEVPEPLLVDPLFVTRRMLEVLRPQVRAIVIVQPPLRAPGHEPEGMFFHPTDYAAARELMGVAAHENAANALAAAIESAMMDKGDCPQGSKGPS
jgi:hypothetical protein